MSERLRPFLQEAFLRALPYGAMGAGATVLALYPKLHDHFCLPMLGNL